jgi:type IV pilus assembly protein PilF
MNIATLLRGPWLLVVVAMGLLSACASGDRSARSDVSTRAAIRLSLAQAYFEQGQHSVAQEELLRSLALDPSNAQAHVLQGLVSMAQHSPEAARASLDRALALDSGLVSALHNRAWLSCQQGRIDQAMTDFDAALLRAQGAERAQTLMVQGVCWAQAQRWDEAHERLSLSLALEPQQAVARYHWARVQQARGQWADAQWTLQSLNRSSDVNAQSLWLAIQGARQLGDTAAAAQWAADLERQFPQSPEWAAYQRKPLND